MTTASTDFPLRGYATAIRVVVAHVPVEKPWPMLAREMRPELESRNLSEADAAAEVTAELNRRHDLASEVHGVLDGYEDEIRGWHDDLQDEAPGLLATLPAIATLRAKPRTTSITSWLRVADELEQLALALEQPEWSPPHSLAWFAKVLKVSDVRQLKKMYHGKLRCENRQRYRMDLRRLDPVERQMIEKNPTAEG